MKRYCTAAWLLVLLVLSSCRRSCLPDDGPGRGNDVQKAGLERIDTTAIGSVRVGKELATFYVAYGFDSAVLGFSVSIGAGAVRYFPIYASTDRGIPPVVLEVLASSSEEEMWVRSSWRDSETLAYHRVGAESTLGAWGEMRFVETPMPEHLSGGPLPFPELPKTVVRKATFNYEGERDERQHD